MVIRTSFRASDPYQIDRLMLMAFTDARNRQSEAATEQEQAKIKITHLEKKICEEEPRAKKAMEQNAALYKDLDRLKAAAEQIKNDMGSLGYEEGSIEEVRQEELSLESKIRELRSQADQLRRQVANTEFHYTEPHWNLVLIRQKGYQKARTHHPQASPILV